MHLEIRLEAQSTLGSNAGAVVQLSPDGRRLAYRTTEGIRLRSLNEVESTLLSGTEGVLQFTFSPDGQWIAFGVNGRLRRVSIDGGAPVDICDTGLVSRGVAWLDDDSIVLAPNFTGGLKLVSLQTGEVSDLTTTNTDAGERSHRWPSRLPDGSGVVFLCQFHNRDYDEGEIRMIRTGEDSSTTIYRGGAAPRCSPTGHLLFATGNMINSDCPLENLGALYDEAYRYGTRIAGKNKQR